MPSHHHSSIHSNARPVLLAAATLMALSAFEPGADAAITGVVPDVVVSAPSNVAVDQTESDTDIIAFDERQCFKLSANLVTDTNYIPATEYNIVSSHLLHVDPANGGSVLTGKARFDGLIIGVISSSALLDDSDVECGASGVTYPPYGIETYRGLESFQARDRYRIIQGGYGIQVEMDVPAFSDQVRVITCCPGYNCDPV
jgi:hypothetical protein